LVGAEDSSIDRSVINQKMYLEKPLSNNQPLKTLLKQLQPTSEIRKVSHVLKILSLERLKMRFVWMLAIYYNELFLIEIKRRFQIAKAELRSYDEKELELLIRHGQKINSEVLMIRKKGFLKHLVNGKIETYEGENAQQMLVKLCPKKEDAIELSGMVASSGHALGKVVVLSYRQSKDHNAKIKTMQKGDIIITEMTRPNIILACEKAGAIVTDEGGILCHAAIVSRELGIPCLIGTKNATQVFKDGDLVEVDTNKRTVRKISK